MRILKHFARNSSMKRSLAKDSAWKLDVGQRALSTARSKARLVSPAEKPNTKARSRRTTSTRQSASKNSGSGVGSKSGFRAMSGVQEVEGGAEPIQRPGAPLPTSGWLARGLW